MCINKWVARSLINVARCVSLEYFDGPLKILFSFLCYHISFRFPPARENNSGGGVVFHLFFFAFSLSRHKLKINVQTPPFCVYVQQSTGSHCLSIIVIIISTVLYWVSPTQAAAEHHQTESNWNMEGAAMTCMRGRVISLPFEFL